MFFDTWLFIKKGNAGLVPGTAFTQDEVLNKAAGRLLTAKAEDHGSPMYITQHDTTVCAGTYHPATSRPTDAAYTKDERHVRVFGDRDLATRHVAEVAVALTQGGFDLLEVLEHDRKGG